MLLKSLIEGLEPLDIIGNIDIDIKNIVFDSRKATNNSLFVCIDGTTTDGHTFIPEAVENGAKAVLVQKEVDLPFGITMIRIKDTRYGLAFVSNKFFNNPSKKFKLIGITGTKGKTTTTFMVKEILRTAGHKIGLVGTIHNMIDDQIIYGSPITTPESYDLQFLFNEMSQAKVNSVVIEVSSQGLNLHRVSCNDFDIGVFTNLYKDHISPKEHKDMEDYLNAKIKLFKMCKIGLVNKDSPYSDKVINEARCDIVTFGIKGDCDIKAYDIVKHPHSVEFKINSKWLKGYFTVNIPGMFTVYNALTAIGVSILMDIPYRYIKKALEKVNVPGRAEIVTTKEEFTVIVDYAHTADSLENILSAVKDFTKGRVICIFGCGGNRDKLRRFGMGEVSGKIADLTIITSDNPRSEDPLSIINDIEVGINKTDANYIKIIDRYEAIKYAILNAKPNDVIVIAGKGHETYQIFKDKTIHFDDREAAKEILEKKCAGQYCNWG
jgi:UDP-N-acetylmuramoyl-L-alanyl-D-glutamate--2,6-diaminopimelate ligase